MMRRLGVIQTPSLTETAWTQAIIDKAAMLGIGVLDARDGGVPEDMDRERTCVVLASTLDVAEAAIHPTDWLIIRDTPAMVHQVMAKRSGEPTGSRLVVRAAAARLAIAQTASTLASAMTIDAVDVSVDAPVLGEVHRQATPVSTPAAEADAGALTVFQEGAAALWPLTLFSFPTRNDVDGATPEFDLTGRARLLMFGPHILLPPGHWAIDVKIAIDPQQREVPLRLEWGGGMEYVEVKQAVSRPGTYAITLEKLWPVAEAAQFRLWLTQARFQGRLRVISCRVRRVTDQFPVGTNGSGGVVDPEPDRPSISA